MSKKRRQKLLNGCVAAAVALSTTLTPLAAQAATPTVTATSNLYNAVTRIGGIDQYATAALISQKGWSGTSDSVILSSGMNYSLVDALAAGPLAAKLHAPILLTDNGTSLNSYAKAELQRLKPTKAYITSGTAVIRQSVLDELKGMGITPIELGGFDQYETSVNIAKELAEQGADISQVLLAAGWLSPADALSAASIAAAQGIPILTTTRDQLPNSVKTYLDSIKANIKDSYIVGGPAVISDTVKSQLPGDVTRYFGQTKYDTNVQILKGMAQDYKNKDVYVANGETLVDALSGVPLAAANQAPIVLVNQNLSAATKDFVKSNMSTTDMVALGGEAVVPTSEMNALTSSATYTTDSAVLGSADASSPVEMTDNVILNGNNSTLENAALDYSVYVKGDNITLSNLTVKGTVFVDPGDTGSATLNGVKAGNIVILSGASSSIHINNTTANLLTVDSSSNVHVDATGSTSIGSTVVRTFAIVDADGGSVGQVTITSTEGQAPVVELKGTFTQPVVVEGAATVTAADGASIAKLTIAPKQASAQVTLGGSFTAVDVNAQANVVLADNAVISNMTTSAQANVIVPPSAKVTTLTDTGNTGTLVSGGGQVNGQTTTSTPSAPAGTTTTGGGAAGGGGGGTVVTPTTPTLALNSVTAQMDNGSDITKSGATSFSYDFGGIGDSVRLKGLQISSSGDNPSLTISSINARGVSNWLDSPITAPLTNGVVSTASLLGSLDTNQNGVSLGTLRMIFGSGTITLQGYLTETSYNNSPTVTVTINLGTSAAAVTSISNQWMTITKTGAAAVQVAIKSGAESETLGDMTKGSNFDFANVVSAMLLDNVKYTTNGLTATQLQQNIINNVPGYVFDSIPLSKLMGKTISFGTNPTYTVTFEANAI